ncbi:MAG TPA: DNA polymerase I, partial [Gemmatimonadales bacterium]
MHVPPHLFLVDGYALIYRAFYALLSRPLRTSRGENTSAAWGVANFLMRLRTKYQPEYLIWVNDAGDSGRTARYPEYKSTREKLDEAMQDDFKLALEQVGALLAAFRVPLVAVPGWEADDVIGTLAHQAIGQGLQSVIVSGDKDLYQLIRPGVALLNPGRGGSAGIEEQWVDLSNATERLGVAPAQVVDYLALVGDSSDNIPGVKGIGDKGARQLLAQFGDLDSILARAGEVTQKRPREALLQFAAEARLSRELVTIRIDAPVSLDLEAVRIQSPDPDRLRQVMARLEFHTLVPRVLGEQGAGSREQGIGSREQGAGSREEEALNGEQAAAVVPAPASLLPAPSLDVTLIVDPALLTGLVSELAASGAFSVRAWTTGGGPREAGLLGLALALNDRAWYLPFAHQPADGALAAPVIPRNLPALGDPSLAPLARLLADAGVAKLTHDAKTERELLRGAGVELAGVTRDLMLESFLIDPGRRSHSLETLALDHLGRSLRPRDQLLGKGKTALGPPQVGQDAAAECAAAELAVLQALAERFDQALVPGGLEPLYREIELPLVEVLVDMEWTGIAIDPALFASLARELGADLERLRRRIGELAGTEFNLNSPRQMAAVLYEKLQLPMLKKTKTGPSTDADVLEQLAAMGHDVPRLIIEHRELEKLRSTYVDVLPARVNRATGRIHTTFNQTGAATGRISSSDPNLQNIPVRTPRGEAIRRGFVPSPGWSFVVADYSQIELRLLAHFSGDPAFVAAFRENGDIHRQTAAVIFGLPVEQVTPDMRARAKTINFATIYGQGAFALSRQLGITQEEARAFIGQYFERFAGVRAWLDQQVKLGRERGWVETLFHRRRYVPEIKDRNFNTRAFGERLAQNSPLQGSAADLIKIAMIRIHRAFKDQRLSARLLLQVHDELVLEAPEEEVDVVQEVVRGHMEG